MGQKARAYFSGLPSFHGNLWTLFYPREGETKLKENIIHEKEEVHFCRIFWTYPCLVFNARRKDSEQR